MSTPQDDEDLRRAFAKLRAHDARGAPSFETLARAAPPEARMPRWAMATPGFAAAAALVVWIALSTPADQASMVNAGAMHSAPVLAAAASAASSAMPSASAVLADPMRARQRVAAAAADLPRG